MTSLVVPGRVAGIEDVLARYPERGRVFVEALSWGDPVADAVVADLAAHGRGPGMRRIRRALAEGIDAVPDASEPVRRLFAEIDAEPRWLDRDLLDTASRAYCRHPVAILTALGTASLVGSYVNGAAVEPLALTRRFTDRGAVRAFETASWLWATARPGGLARYAPGVAATVRVRLIHAFVRHHILTGLTEGAWDAAELGHPINQADSAYTLIEFSLIPLRVMGRLGIPHTDRERAAIYHMFRYVGHLMGVDERVLPTTERDFVELEEIYHRTGARPSAYSRELVAELLDVIMPDNLATQAGPLAPVMRRAARPMVHGLARAFAGDRIADLLDVRRNAWRYLPALLAPPVRLVNSVQRAVPGEMDRKLRRALAFVDATTTATAARLGVGHDLVDAAPDHPAAGHPAAGHPVGGPPAGPPE
ncbi:oxygenase MpaB family protein [Actinocorallia sp. A-T 12471]|uniref:oxygenase MpaB family protein n=1 Tax=Actinocorallia sp. A-T 12471 TaxID=3089813 RepID=UPI0029D01E31|nr:oxygenase MpaB family protein [Actinocorallia sp. A-T 12471]MDX6738735.1 oxygenase MpaB family protein [Actinocorallia sp. A-T 12471]